MIDRIDNFLRLVGAAVFGRRPWLCSRAPVVAYIFSAVACGCWGWHFFLPLATLNSFGSEFHHTGRTFLVEQLFLFLLVSPAALMIVAMHLLVPFTFITLRFRAYDAVRRTQLFAHFVSIIYFFKVIRRPDVVEHHIGWNLVLSSAVFSALAVCCVLLVSAIVKESDQSLDDKSVNP